MDNVREVIIDYTNWQGLTRKRKIVPISIYFGFTIWHTVPQWLLRAIDLESSSRTIKDFALSHIHSWESM